jgi:hypothetical protein
MTKEIGRCRLCLQEKELMDSHVFPEFLYKPLYDGKHRFFRLSTDPDERESIKYKGTRERLLCDDCERLLNQRYEDYASRVLTDQIKVSRNESSERLILHGLDYARFKLFELSILWRCHVAGGQEFAQVNVGEVHSEKLRNMILHQDPGEPEEYGCLIFFSAKIPRALYQQIFPPEPIVIAEFGVYRAVFGGLFWTYVLTDRPETFPLKHLFLSKDGTLILHKNDKFFAQFMVGLGKELSDARKLRGTA